MNTYRDQVTDLIDLAAEALFRAVADIGDPIEKALTAVEVVNQVQDRLLPDVANIRRAAMRDARNRMPAQELADRLGISRARVYAVLSGEDAAAGPLTIKYVTASGGVAEARVSWLVDPIDAGVRVTRREIRRRWNDLLTVVVPENSATSRSPEDAFRSLESQAAYSLGKADHAFEDWLNDKTAPTPAAGDGWYFRPDGASSPGWPRTEHIVRR